MKTEIQVKPCPFCGGKAETRSRNIGWDWKGRNVYEAYAGCPENQCGIEVKIHWNGDELLTEDDDDYSCIELERRAAEIWNKRAEHTGKKSIWFDCPFCGNHASSFSYRTQEDENTYFAYCGCCNLACGIGVELFHTGDDLQQYGETDTCKALERQAIAKWNKRVRNGDD